MDRAISQLGGIFTTISHKIWREVSADVNLCSSGRGARFLPCGHSPSDEFLGIKLTLTQFI